MLFTRRNFRAGRPLKTFPLEEINGVLGFKWGYCGNCNEVIHISRTDCQEILNALHRDQKQYKILDKLKPRFGLKRRLIKWLVGKLGEMPVIIPEEPVYN